MEGVNNSYGTSWADQWDDGPDPISVVPQKKRSNNNINNGTGAAKYKQKVGEGFDKTKTLASTGMKKVKEGTSVGLQWIKSKYHKTTQKR